MKTRILLTSCLIATLDLAGTPATATPATPSTRPPRTAGWRC
ncbi:hypothetical protein [Saccharothrix sp.]|nr:hypothetical protein [Saccharothrix sp.]